MKKIVKKALFAATIGSMIVLAGCGKKEVETETETALIIETESETETETETETEWVNSRAPLEEGQMYSYLTGLPVSEEVGLKRPYAIMINNIQDALPQSGIIDAEMVYEAQVEGGITRLMALYQDVDNVEKIGSIRSSRHYYIDFANDNEAVYVHYGQSKYALKRIEDENIVTIRGISSYEPSVFYRSTDRVAPHNVYTTGEMLAKGLEIVELTRDYPEGYEERLNFSDKEINLEDGKVADLVKIPFDSNPYFTYNQEDGLYYRYQYGTAHIDRETEKQLAFKNIIVQYVTETTISKEDHQDLALNGKGKGLYCTNGKAISIRWERKDNDDHTQYFDTDGNPLLINPGKIFFEVVSDAKKVVCK